MPGAKPRQPFEQLVHALSFHGIDLVVDVGANEGQYAEALRAHGWAGPIVSIEPIPEVRARLAERAGDDSGWTVLPPLALGAADGEAVLELSAESDMSSLLPQTDLLRAIAPSAAVRARLTVRQRRLDGLDLPPGRLFLKLDVQGGEAAVLAGAEGLLPRVAGLQLEMALVPIYEGETPWRAMLDRVEALGFALHLLLPGYYERKLGRQLQMDGVFFRAPATPSP